MRLRIYFFIALAALSVNAYSQYSTIGYKSSKFLQFKASKTYAVTTGDKNYDDDMAAALNDCWKVTPFELITPDEFNKKVRDENASFLVSVVIEGDYVGTKYNFLMLVMGGKGSFKQYNYTDMLAFAPINHNGNESNNTDCGPRLVNMLESMLKAMDIVEQEDIKGEFKKMEERMESYYRKQAYKIKDRTLLISQDLFGKKIDENDITNTYPYKFEVCSQQKINEAIKNKNKSYYYYQPAYTQNKFAFVFDPATGEVVYANYERTNSTHLNKKDIEDLVDAIGKK